MTSGKETVGEQPIFTCKAHVFHIDPKTKRSWLPASTTSINVSFFYDSTRSLYRIISVEGAKAVINSTVTPNMAFTKTSQKFGQWSDLRANTVYGLGFSSESELNKFIDKFQEVKEATRLAPPKPLTNGSVTTPAASTGTGSACSVTPTSAGGLANMPALVSANASPVTTRSVTFSDPGVIEPPNLQPTTPSSTVPSINSEDIVDSKAAQQRSQTFTNSQVDSPKHQHSDTKTPPVPPLPTQASGGQTITSSSTESQLKYENDRLKLALAQSSANAKKWEIELNTLKTNNHRLTSALQESTANVDEWKRQLQSYKEENQKLKNKYIELEASKCGVEGTPELRKELNLLRMKVETLEIELQTKEEDIKRLLSAKNPHEEKCKILMQDNAELQAAISLLQTQLDTALSAQESQRRVMDTLNSQLAIRIQELIGIHKEMSTALQT